MAEIGQTSGKKKGRAICRRQPLEISVCSWAMPCQRFWSQTRRATRLRYTPNTQ